MFLSCLLRGLTIATELNGEQNLSFQWQGPGERISVRRAHLVSKQRATSGVLYCISFESPRTSRSFQTSPADSLRNGIAIDFRVKLV